MAVLAVLLWRPPTVSNELLTEMAVVSSIGVSARCCHHAGVLEVADLPTVCVQTTITMNHHHEPSPRTITITMNHHHEPSPWTITMNHHHEPSPWTITMNRHHEPSPWTITMNRHHEPSPWIITKREQEPLSHYHFCSQLTTQKRHSLCGQNKYFVLS